MAEGLGSYAIFCDDIRQEITGKQIYIGVYRDALFVAGDPPWNIPSFHVQIVWRELQQDPTPSLRFQVRLLSEKGTVVLADFEPPTDALVSPAPETGVALPFEPRNLPKLMQAVFGIVLSPLVLDSECRISVHAVVNGRDTQIDRLRVLKRERLEEFARQYTHFQAAGESS